MSTGDNLSLKNLFRDLATVAKPIEFGVILGVPEPTLTTIAANNHLNIDGQRMGIFKYISNNFTILEITWATIADALDKIGQGNLAGKIRHKHNISIPNSQPSTAPATAPVATSWISHLMIAVTAVVFLILTTSMFSSPGDLSSNVSHSKDHTLEHEITDVNELYKAVKDIPGEWMAMCIALQVPDGVLSELELSEDRPVHRMNKCLKVYYNTGKSVWEDVVLAVAEAPIYNPKLAMKIASKHGVDYNELMHSRNL